MKKVSKKILAYLLVVIMIFSVLPMTAYAEEQAVLGAEVQEEMVLYEELQLDEESGTNENSAEDEAAGEEEKSETNEQILVDEDNVETMDAEEPSVDNDEVAERGYIDVPSDIEDGNEGIMLLDEEDYRTWAQADSRWGSIYLGNSGYTMKNSGCLVTSVTKLIVQCGLRSADSFNPGTLVEWLNENEGFNEYGGLYWAKPGQCVSGFSFYSKLISSGTHSSTEYDEQIISWIESGYHLVLQVNYGSSTHWVAVDEAKTLATGEVYIMDTMPNSVNADITLAERYTTFNQVAAFKGGSTPTPEDENPFVDVSESDYYYDAVLWAYENGITQGKDDTHFQPAGECTRAQVVTFLWRSQGEPEPKTTNNPFTDVNTSDYYYKAVLWAYENGITNGKTATEFQPEVVVSRSQFVTFLWRAEGEPAVTIENPFEDVSTGEYYTDAVLWAYDNGITQGKDATHFQPFANCQRCQVVTFLYRAYQ